MHWLIELLALPATLVYWVVAIPVAILVTFSSAYFLVLLWSVVSGPESRHAVLNRRTEIKGWWVMSFVVIAWLLAAESALVWWQQSATKEAGGLAIMVPTWLSAIVAVIAALVVGWPFRAEAHRYQAIENQLTTLPPQ